MQSNGKTLCKIFDSEIFLYLDNTLSSERKELFREHLRNCEICSKLLKETEDLLVKANESITVDLDSDLFEKMVNKAASKNQNGLLKKLSVRMPNRKEKFIHWGKISFASAMVVIAVIISLLSDKPNTVKTVSKEILDWEGEKISIEIDEIKGRIEFIRTQNMNTWNRETDAIDKQLKRLEKESDPYSF
ncbi:MAG: zf-HC2 domain-containing protein [Bacteroidota bacterium]